MFKFFKKKKDLRIKGIQYIKDNFGDKYIEEFCDKYDKINNGIPIGNLKETIMFLSLIDEIKKS